MCHLNQRASFVLSYNPRTRARERPDLATWRRRSFLISTRDDHVVAVMNLRPDISSARRRTSEILIIFGAGQPGGVEPAGCRTGRGETSRRGGGVVERLDAMDQRPATKRRRMNVFRYAAGSGVSSIPACDGGRTLMLLCSLPTCVHLYLPYCGRKTHTKQQRKRCSNKRGNTQGHMQAILYQNA